MATRPRESAARRAPTDPSVDADEIARFSALADDWWDADGPMAPLHALSPVRIAYVRDRLAARLGRDPLAPRPLAGIALADVGCGGGLMCEPLCRLGAAVTGIDAAADSVSAAAAHAAEMGLDIDYRCITAGALADEGATFDAVIALEVVEHVADLDAFLADCCRLVKPGGAMALATLNRTAKAFLLAVVGAERILRWLPPGTHDWARFVRPSELAAALGRDGMSVVDLSGVSYDLARGEWRRSRDVAVNYMAFAVKG